MKPWREHRLIAVWGSPGSGKTTTAMKLAIQYQNEKKRTALVFSDLITPALPCVFDDRDLLQKRSMGSIFAAKTVIPELIEANLCRIKGLENLALFGLLKGEQGADYPPPGEMQAGIFFRVLNMCFDRVVVDCSSDYTNSVLTRCALKETDSVVRLMDCEVKSLSYYASNLPLLQKDGISDRYFYRVISRVEDEERMKQMYPKTTFVLPYTEELARQSRMGDLSRRLELKQSRSYVEMLQALAAELET